jgi:hypothetical protein
MAFWHGVRATVLLVSVLGGGACGGGDAAPGTQNPVAPSPVSPPGASDDRAFQVAVLMNASQSPLDDDVRRVFARADDILFRKTGERMKVTDVRAVAPGDPLARAQAYVQEQSAPPDGVLFFSDDASASRFGGYSVTFPLPAPHTNRYPSPVKNRQSAYLAVVHYSHMYSRCGYDDAGNRIGTTSSGGECQGRDGIVCVDNGRHWACPGSERDQYAEQEYFTACSIVHEFLHPFGSDGNGDHYGTPQCRARTGMSQSDALNSVLTQQNCAMCPDLFTRFRRNASPASRR